MARKASGTILQEELYPPNAEHSRAESARAEFSRQRLSSDETPRDFPSGAIDDARLIDLDVNEGSPFLRGQKRVSVRRSALPRKAAHGLLWVSGLAAVLFVGALVAAGLYHYGEHSWRFRVESSDNIEILGMQNVTRAQIMEVMGADIGRNIFFVPLAEQKALLEQVPWVESASVMRFVPNRLRVEIHERTPVAFARVGPRIALIDAGGTLMDLPKTPLPRNHKYSFPVILGMNPGEPLSTRAPRMKAYSELVHDLDSSGAHYSQDLSEVDLSDLEDLKVRVNDPAGDVLVHLGSSDYLKRFNVYVSHVQEWRQQFQKLESVNLRYDNQVIVNPDMEGAPKPARLTLAVSKASAGAGVKPAALVTKVGTNDKALPKPVFELSKTTLDAAAGKKPAKAKAKKPSVKASKHGKRETAKVAGPATGTTNALASPPKTDEKKTDEKKPVSVAKTTTSGAVAKPSAAIAKQPATPAQN
jgi:cell division protein FtsQ